MYFTESHRDVVTQPTEHVAAATISSDTVCRPLPKRALLPVHNADHSTQESAEDIKPDRKASSKQEYDAIYATPAGLESQDLVDQPKPGHWNKDGQGGIHLGSFRFPHPHFSNRLSLDDPDGLLSEVINRGGTYDNCAASEPDDLILPADRVEGAAPSQRRYSTSSSGDDRADDQQGCGTHPNFLAKRQLPELGTQPLILDPSL
jgi:hypothetical protein